MRAVFGQEIAVTQDRGMRGHFGGLYNAIVVSVFKHIYRMSCFCFDLSETQNELV